MKSPKVGVLILAPRSLMKPIRKMYIYITSLGTERICFGVYWILGLNRNEGFFENQEHN